MHLETGDLLLFTQKKSITGWWLIDKTIEYFTNSPYVHVGLVVVDPPFSVSSGTYVWECGYEACVNPETGKQNIGVRLTPISVVLSNEQTIYVRKCKTYIPDKMLQKIHSEVFLKPYDMCLSDWLLATLRVDLRPQKTDRFWCSAFIAYIFTQIGWLDNNTDWSIIRPCDLSSSSTYISWKSKVYGGDMRYKKFERLTLIASLKLKLAALGIEYKQKSDSEIQVPLNQGFIHINISEFIFETSVVDTVKTYPIMSFTKQKSLVKYILDIRESINV
uniref:Peptidase n=1 Tax=viral metagenome TaxID=1070528 RepID=A0A6C0H3B6_9ZZZZ